MYVLNALCSDTRAFLSPGCPLKRTTPKATLLASFVLMQTETREMPWFIVFPLNDLIKKKKENECDTFVKNNDVHLLFSVISSLMLLEIILLVSLRILYVGNIFDRILNFKQCHLHYIMNKVVVCTIVLCVCMFNRRPHGGLAILAKSATL